jgi:hypothetical protein
LTAKPCIPPYIFIFFFVGVLAAVHFDNQAFFKGDEINNVIPEWLLSSKLDAFNVFAFQMKPKAIFGIGCPFSQDSGNLSRSFPRDYATPTLTLPHQGGGNNEDSPEGLSITGSVEYINFHPHPDPLPQGRGELKESSTVNQFSALSSITNGQPAILSPWL